MNIYGGLRMGGEALYGLNISTPSAPSLLFHNTPATPGFSRMAQIWSKPTIANVRVKGEKKRVLILVEDMISLFMRNLQVVMLNLPPLREGTHYIL